MVSAMSNTAATTTTLTAKEARALALAADTLATEERSAADALDQLRDRCERSAENIISGGTVNSLGELQGTAMMAEAATARVAAAKKALEDTVRALDLTTEQPADLPELDAEWLRRSWTNSQQVRSAMHWAVRRNTEVR